MVIEKDLLYRKTDKLYSRVTELFLIKDRRMDFIYK